MKNKNVVFSVSPYVKPLTTPIVVGSVEEQFNREKA